MSSWSSSECTWGENGPRSDGAGEKGEVEGDDSSPGSAVITLW